MGLSIFDIFGWGPIQGGGGGLITGETYKIIVDIKKTLIKDFVYFSRNFFISIQLIITKSMNFCGNPIKHQRQPQMAKTIKFRRANLRIYSSSGGLFFFWGGGLFNRVGAYPRGGLFLGWGGGNTRIYGSSDVK